MNNFYLKYIKYLYKILIISNMQTDIIYKEKFKTDKKDKKIIEALYDNGRAPISEIAKKTGLRRDSVAYRIKRLIENDVISFIIPILNPPRLGYPFINGVMIKANIGLQEEESKFVNSLKHNKNIIGVSILNGKWDYMITVCSKNPEEFNEIIKNVRNIIPGFILDYDIFTIIKEPKYDRMNDLL